MSVAEQEARFSQLVMEVVDEVATPEELAEFRALLCEHPEFKLQYLEQMRIHGLMSYRATMWSGERFAGTVGPLDEETVSEPPGERRGSDSSVRHRPMFRFWLKAAAAALIVAGVAVWRSVYGTLGLGEERSVFPSVRDTPASLPCGPVQLVKGDGVSGLSLPSVLPGKIRLEAGQARVRLLSGVELFLRGPLELSVRSDMEVRLASGKLLAWVPKRASGFTVHAPGLEIWDMGTIFGVSSRGGVSDVFVFKGSVQVNEASGDGVGLCLAGQGVRAGVSNLLPVVFSADLPKVQRAFDLVKGDAALHDPAAALAVAGMIADLWQKTNLPVWARKSRETERKTLVKAFVNEEEETVMSMTNNVTVALAAALLTASQTVPLASAADQVWTNLSGGAWNSVENWSGGSEPGVGEDAYITNAPSAYTINYDVPMSAATFGKLTMGNDAGVITLNVNTNGFKSYCATGMLLGTNAVINVGPSGVAIFNSGYNKTQDIRGSLNVNGGTASIEYSEYVFFQQGATVTVNSGKLSVMTKPTAATGNVINFARTGTSALNINGGFVDLKEGAYFGYMGSGKGTLTMTGGVLSLGTLHQYITQFGNATGSGVATVSGGVVTNQGPLGVGNDDWTGAGSGIFTLSGGEWNQKGNVILSKTRGVGKVYLYGGHFACGADISLGLPGTSYDTANGWLEVAGGTHCATNESRTATLLVRRGTLLMTNGTMTVDNLVSTNGTVGVLKLWGGDFTVNNGSDISNGVAAVFGNGVLSATVSLVAGTHRFANGLVVTNNATLAVGGTGAVGAVAIAGNVRLASGAILDVDVGAASNDFAEVSGTVTLPAAATVSLRLSGTELPAQIPVLHASDGIVGTVEQWGRILVNGVKYRASISGNTLLLKKIAGGTIVSVL